MVTGRDLSFLCSCLCSFSVAIRIDNALKCLQVGVQTPYVAVQEEKGGDGW
jgi:hypothetical protein